MYRNDPRYLKMALKNLDSPTHPVSEAIAADSEMLVALWEACGLTRPWNDPRADFRMAIEGATSTVLVIRTDGAIAASAMVGFDGHRGWLYYLCVAPDRQRSGLGQAMLAHAEAWLHKQGAPKLQLMVRDDNVAALSFYEALGMERQTVVVFGKRLG